MVDNRYDNEVDRDEEKITECGSAKHQEVGDIIAHEAIEMLNS